MTHYLPCTGQILKPLTYSGLMASLVICLVHFIVIDIYISLSLKSLSIGEEEHARISRPSSIRMGFF